MPKCLAPLGRLLSVLTIALLLILQPALSRPASAEDGGFSLSKAGYHLLNGRWMSAGPLYGAGGSQLSGSDEGLDPTVVGLRYSERKGFVTGAFFALVMAFGGAAAAASPKSIDYYQSGNTLWEVTTYRSAAEQQQIMDNAAEAGADMMSAEDQSVELEVYATSLPGGGESSGYKLNMYFGAKFSDYVILDMGIGWGSVDSRFQRDARDAHIHLSYFGLPMRLNVAAGPLLVQLRWDWNWLGDWSEHTRDRVDLPGRFTERSTMSHIELGLTTCIFERLMLQAAVTTPTIDSGDFGYRASVGLRF